MQLTHLTIKSSSSITPFSQQQAVVPLCGLHSVQLSSCVACVNKDGLLCAACPSVVITAWKGTVKSRVGAGTAAAHWAEDSLWRTQSCTTLHWAGPLDITCLPCVKGQGARPALLESSHLPRRSGSTRAGAFLPAPPPSEAAWLLVKGQRGLLYALSHSCLHC